MLTQYMCNIVISSCSVLMMEKGPSNDMCINFALWFQSIIV